MKSKLNFVLGFVLGAIVFGGATAFAAGIIANPTTSKVLVNGSEIKVEAYNINGSNYFKLRDIGQALDFAVTWDGANNRILIDDRLPYGYDVPTPEEIAAIKNGTSVTPTPSAPSPAGTVPAAHDVKFSPLRKGDTVKTEAVPKWKSTIGGDYKIAKDCFDVEAERNKAGVNFSDLAYGAALPAWKAEWNGFPAIEVKDPETAHYKSGQNDRLDVYNPYEAQRMVRAIYTYANAYAYLWKDEARTIPNFTIVSEFPADNQGWFFPWRGGVSVEGKVKSLSAGGTIHIYALDVYYNGEFKDTEYWCWN